MVGPLFNAGWIMANRETAKRLRQLRDNLPPHEQLHCHPLILEIEKLANELEGVKK